MGAKNEESVEPDTESGQREYPFGLSSRQLFVFVVLVGLIAPGLLVYALEEANLSAIGDLVWIVGYGTTVFVVWFIWIRPMDLVGSSGQDKYPTEEITQSETKPNGHDEESAITDTESPEQDSTPSE
jgi:hypothetical protein